MTCDHKNSFHSISQFHEGELITVCDRCGLEGAGEGIPDVYLGYVGQKFQALCDDMGRPIEIRSKKHKKEVMDKLGVSEAGDVKHTGKNWIDGSRDHRRKQFERERPHLRENYQKYLDNVRRKS